MWAAAAATSSLVLGLPEHPTLGDWFSGAAEGRVFVQSAIEIVNLKWCHFTLGHWGTATVIHDGPNFSLWYTRMTGLKLVDTCLLGHGRNSRIHEQVFVYRKKNGTNDIQITSDKIRVAKLAYKYCPFGFVDEKWLIFVHVVGLASALRIPGACLFILSFCYKWKDYCTYGRSQGFPV